MYLRIVWIFLIQKFNCYSMIGSTKSLKARNHILMNETVPHSIPLYIFFLKLGFTPCKAEQPLKGMNLKEKEAQKV